MTNYNDKPWIAKVKVNPQSFSSCYLGTFQGFSMCLIDQNWNETWRLVWKPFVYELLHELSDDGRLNILVNKEILGKSQIWVRARPRVQCKLHKWMFGSSVQNHAKADIEVSWNCPTAIFYFFQICFVGDCT